MNHKHRYQVLGSYSPSDTNDTTFTLICLDCEKSKTITVLNDVAAKINRHIEKGEYLSIENGLISFRQE